MENPSIDKIFEKALRKALGEAAKKILEQGDSVPRDLLRRVTEEHCTDFGYPLETCEQAILALARRMKNSRTIPP